MTKVKEVKFKIKAVYLTNRKGAQSYAVANVYYIKRGAINTVYNADGTVLKQTEGTAISIKHGMGINKDLYDTFNEKLMTTDKDGKVIPRELKLDEYPSIGLSLYHEVNNPDGDMIVTERTETWVDEHGVEQKPSVSRWISTRDVKESK